jgi:peptidoglycan/LPS O-acetylase OafA/YrhL
VPYYQEFRAVAVPLVIWAVTPYPVLALFAYLCRRSTRSLIAVLAASAVIAAFPVLALRSNLPHPDPLSGLIILPLPILQLLFSSPLLLAAMWLRRRNMPGCCRRCGYCIEHLCDATVCPECGRQIDRSAGADS